MQFKAPKMLRVDQLRAALGDAEAERLVTAYMVALRGTEAEPVLKVRVTPENWEAAIKAVTQPGSYQAKGTDNVTRALPAFRAYFVADPRARKKFINVATERLAVSNGNGHQSAAVDPVESEIIDGLAAVGIPVSRRTRKRRALATGGAE
jgi:hypothetical protein